MNGVSFLNGKDAEDKKAKFCEVLGPGFCRECSREGSRNENREEVYEIFWSPKSCQRDFVSETPLYDAVSHREYCPATGFDLDIDSRQKFMRLHNFNKAPKYFINPSDGMEGSVERPEPREATTEPDDSADNSVNRDLSVMPGSDESTLFFRKISKTAESLRYLCKMNRISKHSQRSSSNAGEGTKGVDPGALRSGSSKEANAGASFRRLPIEPPLLTVDFANSIMNPEATKEQLEAALYGTTTLNITACEPSSHGWE